MLPSEVSMAASLADGVAGDEDTWTREDAICYGILERLQSATTIANRREAAMEHLRANVGLPKNGDIMGVAESLGEVTKARDGHEVDV
jgi:hypothetical protein